jgi:AsmA family protein
VQVRRILIRTAVAAGLLAALGAGAMATLLILAPAPVIEWYAAHALGRSLSLGAVRLDWRRGLSVEIRDLHLANADWAREPDMLHIDYLSAEVDLDALWDGVLRFRRLRLEKPVLTLERGPGEARNWRFGAKPSPSRGGLALIPKNRTQFPTLLDFAIHDGRIVLRAPDRPDLRIDFYNLAIRSSGDDQPVQLTVDGAYNRATMRLNGETASFDELRRADRPFRTAFQISTVPGHVSFDGTMGEPVDFDGVKGSLQIEAQNLGDLLKVFGADTAAPFAATLNGTLDKTGEHWQVSAAKGRLASSEFADGTLALDEGPRGGADRIKVGLDFDRLYLNALLAGNGSNTPVSLRPDEHPGAVFDARISAKQVVYGALPLGAARLEVRTRPGEVALDNSSVTFAGGTVDLAGTLRAVPQGGRIDARATLAGIDIARLMSPGDQAEKQITGKVDGRLVLSATAPTTEEALKTANGEAVFAMNEGQVSRDLLEKASTDLRALFRRGEGRAQLSCLLGVVDLHDGVAAIAPVRLRTTETTLIGAGRADLAKDRLDAIIKAAGGSTSVFALKVPLRVSGPFDKLTVKPYLGAEPPYLGAALKSDPLRALSVDLQQFAERSACLK